MGRLIRTCEHEWTQHIGDISPQTPLGKALASLLMILGYGIIAVPTGLITVGLTQARLAAEGLPESGPEMKCRRCGLDTHVPGARYCSRCGEALPGPEHG